MRVAHTDILFQCVKKFDVIFIEKVARDSNNNIDDRKFVVCCSVIICYLIISNYYFLARITF